MTPRRHELAPVAHNRYTVARREPDAAVISTTGRPRIGGDHAGFRGGVGLDDRNRQRLFDLFADFGIERPGARARELNSRVRDHGF